MPYNRLCEKCGKEFIDPRISRPQRFCSRNCANWRGFNLADLLLRFAVEKNGCLVWQRCLSSGGYATIQCNGKSCQVHRLVWEEAHGSIQSNLVIRHLCNNPAYVNINHLAVGTQADNIMDRDLASRQASGDRHGFRLHPEVVPRGSKNGHAKLIEEEVREIRKLASVSGEALANRFGVSTSTISLIRRGKTWRHIL